MKLSTKQYILLLLLIILFSIYYIVIVRNNANFYINEDSYEFLIPSLRYGNLHLGVLNNNISELFLPSFYNRIGYSLLIYLISNINFFKLDTNLVLHFLNFFFLCCSAFLIISISVNIKKNFTIGLFVAILYLFCPITTFVSGLILNDTISIFFMLLSLHFLINEKTVSFKVIICFMIVSSLRIEALFILIPIYFLLDLKNKQRLFFIIPLSIVFNLVLLAPYISNVWIDKQLSIISVLKLHLIYYPILALSILILFKIFTKYVLPIFTSITLIICSYQLVSQLSAGLNNFEPLILSLLPFLFIFIFIKLIGIKYRENHGKEILNKSNENLKKFFIVSFCFFIIFYQSLYFQHLVIIIPFLSLYLGYEMHEVYEAYSISKKDLNIYSSKILSYSMMSILLFVLVLVSYIIYQKEFSFYDKDLASTSLNITEAMVRNDGLNYTNCLVVSNFSKANYYIYHTTSLDLKNIDKLNQNKVDNSCIVVSSFEDTNYTIQNYSLLNKQYQYISLKYNYIEGNGVGLNWHNLYVSTYKLTSL